MDIKDDLGYMEGVYIAEGLPRHIATSSYGSIRGAIDIKQKLIDAFEKEFGYSRSMPVTKFDYNYAYNCGMLDKLREMEAKNAGKTT